MGLKKIQLENKELYIAPKSFGDVEFQEKALGMPLQMVSQEEFIEEIFAHFTGHLCIFQKRSNGTTANTLFKKKDREKMYAYLSKTYGMDTYVCYSTLHFKKEDLVKNDRKKAVESGTKSKPISEIKVRTQTNIEHTYMLVQDLDYYKHGIDDHTFLKGIKNKISNGEIICPNYLVSTGRGYQLIWLVEPFKNIPGYSNDRDWRAIQDHLYDVLSEFDSDRVVKSPSAVTRLAGSKHRASGNNVYGMIANKAKFELQDFLFFHDIVPTSNRKVQPKNVKLPKSGSITRIVSNWNEYTLNKQREADIFTFVRVQNSRGISYVGIRNWLCLVLRFQSLVVSDGDFEYAKNKVLELCSEMDLTDTDDVELLRRSKGAEKFYTDWKNGTWDKEKYISGGLFYSNARLLELMRIKEDYYVQWKMKTIKYKTKDYEAARKRFERLEKGQVKSTLAEYSEKRSNDKADKIERIRSLLANNPKMKQKEIAENLGLTKGRVSQMMKEL